MLHAIYHFPYIYMDCLAPTDISALPLGLVGMKARDIEGTLEIEEAAQSQVSLDHGEILWMHH